MLRHRSGKYSGRCLGVELTPVIVNQLKPGGIYITSGIIDDKEEMVKEAVAKAGLELLDVTYQGEWVCVTARKNA